MFGSEPRKFAAYVSSPGLLLASAINSGNVLTPTALPATIMNDDSPMMPIGTRSRSKSRGSLGLVSGSTTSDEELGR